MKGKLFATLFAAVSFVVVSFPVFAHHSRSSYDSKHEMTVTGTVTEFDFVNPHIIIHMQSKDENGQTVEWLAEGAPPNNMRRAGWTKYTLKPGDQVTLTVQLPKNPAKGGARDAFVQKVTMNGKDLYFADRGDNN